MLLAMGRRLVAVGALSAVLVMAGRRGLATGVFSSVVCASSGGIPYAAVFAGS